MKTGLSPVYLDDRPVTLPGDEARPSLSRIVRAVGKRPDRVDVRWLKSPSDADGKTLGREATIDRTTEPAKPIYLRSVARPAADRAARAAGAAALSPPASTLAPEPANAQPPLAFPNADPVIAQLGAEPPTSRTDLHAPGQPTAVHPPSRPAAGSIAPAPLLPRSTRSRDAKHAEAQDMAEAEAEQRKEEQREEEDILQDEQEALAEADEDDGPMS